MHNRVCHAFLGISMAAGGALLAAGPLPLPEAWAPFSRTAPARREVKFAAFSYRTGRGE